MSIQIARLMKKKASLRIEVGGEPHTITVDSLSSDSVTLTIASEPFTVDINSNSTKQIDVNADGVNDLEIYYHKMHQGSADLVFTEILVPVVTPTDVVAPPVDTTPPPTDLTPEDEGGFGWVWFLIVIIVIALILMIILHKLSRGSGSKDSNVKFTPRDLGADRENSTSSWSSNNSSSSENSDTRTFY